MVASSLSMVATSMAHGSIATRSITVIHHSIAAAPRSAAALGWEHYSKQLAAAPPVLASASAVAGGCPSVVHSFRISTAK
jgi:hypothetical protein